MENVCGYGVASAEIRRDREARRRQKAESMKSLPESLLLQLAERGNEDALAELDRRTDPNAD